MKKLDKINLFLNNYSQYLLFSAVILYVLLFSFVSLWKYYNFQYNGLDLAIINQVFYNSRLGNFFASSIHPPTYLGDHFTPILFLLLPIYYLFHTPQTLLILQTLFLAACAWPIYLIAKKVLSKNWSLLLACVWLLNPFVQNINLFEFHFLPFAIFFIFWIFYFYQKEKFWPFLIFIILALLVREDVALVIFVFGFLAILEKKKLKWWLTPIVLSLVYFILAIKISSLLALTGQYKFLHYYAWLGNSWIEIIKTIIFQPWILLPKIFNLGSLIVALALLLPTAYLPFLKPKYLLFSLLIYLQLIIGVNWNWLAMILFTQYSSLLLPGIFLATIFGLKKINNKSEKKLILSFILKEKPLAILIATGAVIYSTLTIGPLPGSLAEIIKQGVISPETKIKNEILAKIPPQAAIAAGFDFLTPLSSRQNIYSLNYVFLGKQQFLAKDYALPQETQYLAFNFQDLIAYQSMYEKNPSYQKARQDWPKIINEFGLIEIKNNFALYQKGVENKFTLVKVLTNPPRISRPADIALDQNIKFIGFEKTKNHYQLFWQIDFPLEKNYYLELTITGNEKIVYQKIYPFAYGLLGEEDNTNKKIIQTNYWFEFPPEIKEGNYNLSLNLMEIVESRIEIDSTRATKNAIDEKNLIEPQIPLGQINF